MKINYIVMLKCSSASTNSACNEIQIKHSSFIMPKTHTWQNWHVLNGVDIFVFSFCNFDVDKNMDWDVVIWETQFMKTLFKLKVQGPPRHKSKASRTDW